jgi:hypothetical protein
LIAAARGMRPVRIVAAAAAAVALSLVPAFASPAAAAAEGKVTASITYVTSTTVYLDAGAKAGLMEGERVDVVRDGGLIDILQVTAVSSTRAACKRADASVDLVVGDQVTFQPHFPELPAAGSAAGTGGAAAGGDAESAGPGWIQRQGIRGRVGIRYLGIFDGSGFGGDYSQPALDLRLDGRPPDHPKLSYSADVRTRRTYRSTPSGESSSEGLTRVYRLYAAYGAESGFRAIVGRQFATELTSIGVYDGATVEYGLGRWRAGAFAGLQPDAIDFGFSTDLREHGAYISWRDNPTGRVRWAFTGGFVGSYQDGDINRESAVLQARFVGDRAFAYAIQEVDINRGWRMEAEGTSLSATGTFVSGRYRLTEKVAVDGGFDSRRNVRVYRDRITPETEFDDSARRGYWSGVELRPARAARIALTLRLTEGGSSGDAESATLNGNARLGGPLRNTVSVRSTAYRNDLVEGGLHSFSLGADLGWRAHLTGTAGLRKETAAATGARPADLRWYSVDLDCRLTQAWLLLVSAETSEGDVEKSTQVYTSAVYRF